jgi:hypothetical protein
MSQRDVQILLSDICPGGKINYVRNVVLNLLGYKAGFSGREIFRSNMSPLSSEPKNNLTEELARSGQETAACYYFSHD